MGYGIADPNVAERDCKLQWSSDGRLTSFTRKWSESEAKEVLHVHEVDLEGVLSYMEGKTSKRSLNTFDLINKICPMSLMWISGQGQSGMSTALPEARYPMNLWGLTTLQLAEFIRRGYTVGTEQTIEES